jgi:hypothetical protein
MGLKMRCAHSEADFEEQAKSFVNDLVDESCSLGSRPTLRASSPETCCDSALRRRVRVSTAIRQSDLPCPLRLKIGARSPQLGDGH